MKQKDRIYGLDLMRAIAISMVVLSHALYIFHEYNNSITQAMQVIGVQGVEVFFVLSGFLIGGILLRLLKDRDFTMKVMLHFWLRRWFRTLPLYYLMLLINIIVGLIIGYNLPQEIWKYFFFLQNFHEYHIPFFPESWSLSVEEYAYLLAPLCIYFWFIFFNGKAKRRDDFFLYASLFLVSVFFASKIGYYILTIGEPKSLDLWNSNLKAIVVYRLDAIFYGFLLVYVFKRFNAKIIKLKNKLFILGMAFWLIVLIVLPVFGVTIEKFPFYWNVLYLPFNSIAICLMLPYLYFLKKPHKRWSKVIESISLYSYAIYLVHYTFFLYLIRLYFDFESFSLFECLVCAVFYLVITYLLSKYMYLYFERPITDLRDSKFVKSKFV
ncbi:acyltransferase family protein [Seonamhaeicola maritimus]|uniref:Acyltransferase n=1 Tax=Seonamhaeicola maritimus TaxID=2591822 RepID=A0A5C7GDP0_9FLAO|nr:acyltransferase [Seonamhaeicola maritimus]TXG34531.1 acyltransferase [Seonamhaeicola maritimus]